MKNFTKHTTEQIIKAIKLKHGVITDVAKALGVTTRAVRMRVSEEIEIQEALTEARDEMFDTAESVIFESLSEHRNVETAKWYLKSFSKDKGYSDKVVLDGKIKVENDYDFSDLSTEDLVSLEQIIRKSSKPSTD